LICGSASCFKHSRTATAWSLAAILLSNFLSPACTKQRDSGEPIRSTPPRASSFSPAMSNKRYLKLVLPRLATRIFIASLRQRSHELHRNHKDRQTHIDHDGNYQRGCRLTLGDRVLCRQHAHGAHDQRNLPATKCEQDQQDHVGADKHAVERALLTS